MVQVVDGRGRVTYNPANNIVVDMNKGTQYKLPKSNPVPVRSNPAPRAPARAPAPPPPPREDPNAELNRLLEQQRKAQAEAEAKAAAEKKAAEDRAAKQARAESQRQNAVTREQAQSQRKLIDKFDDARDIKLGNITSALQATDSALLKSHSETAGRLVETSKDNEKAEGADSFANLTNRLRESSDLLAETASMGAGESDTLRTQMQAIRNWSANQSDVNRSYFDTLTSVNNSITDVNNDTRTGRINAFLQSESDKEQAWSNYYDQIANTWTQIYNIEGSNQYLGYKPSGGENDSEKANPIEAYKRLYANAADEAAKAAGSSYKQQGVSTSLSGWEGQKKIAGQQNSTLLDAAVYLPELKKPEGATLRKW